ncbi:MAG: class I SAM-dependent methyltransferase [Candidatus Bathyarchaeia archaeon]
MSVGFETYGMDISSYAIHKARELTKRTVLYIKNAEDLFPFPDEYFHIVTLFDVIEHLKFPKNAIKESQRVLKPEGIICLTTPNPIGMGRIFLSRFFEKWREKDSTHISVNFPWFWVCLLKALGFRILEIKFYIENLFGKFDISLPYLGGTTMIIAKKEVRK